MRAFVADTLALVVFFTLLGALAYGELAADTKLSPRVAPSVFGSGLLEAIPESQILERNDPEDLDGDGISGHPNHVWDPLSRSALLGRFGWKLNQPSIAHQTAAAFSSEIGMSTSFRPDQICTAAQTACAAAPTGGLRSSSGRLPGWKRHSQSRRLLRRRGSKRSRGRGHPGAWLRAREVT